MTVTVYSKPGCPPCNATKRRLGKLKIEFQEIDIIENPEALAYVRSLGYLQAPVVVAGDLHWSGFKDDLIDSLVPAPEVAAPQAV